LRTKGTLYQGTIAPSAVAANKFELIGNTYVSPIDFTLLNTTGGITASGPTGSTFYIWDPKAGTTTLGAYQTFSPLVGIPLGGYVPFLPGSYGNGTPGNPFRSNKIIEAGQGFLVKSTGVAGTIGLNENAKVIGLGINVFRPTAPLSNIQAFSANLLYANGSRADGNTLAMNEIFSNGLDGSDAVKLANGSENWGMKRNGVSLVVEARQPVALKDTVFYEMWNLGQTEYKLEFIPTDMNVAGLTATLKDRYLNSTANIDLSASGTTFSYPFSINTTIPASFARDRFQVVFLQSSSAPVPVNFISISANKLGADIKVDWKVASERSISSYVVERSVDGRRFTQAGTVVATGNSNSELSYTWLDATPLTGTSFYRIKSLGIGGEIKYSYIAKVSIGDVKPGYTVSPNPVEGSVVNIQFKNQPQGRYNIRLLGNNGQVIFTSVAEHAGGFSNQILHLPGMIAGGTYQLEVVSPNKIKDVQTVFINKK